MCWLVFGLRLSPNTRYTIALLLVGENLLNPSRNMQGTADADTLVIQKIKSVRSRRQRLDFSHGKVPIQYDF
jgi:hypothetical protein